MRQILTVSDVITNGGLCYAELNDAPSKTDPSGYISPAKSIPRMLEAGVLLDRNRATNGYYEYTSQDKPSDITVDPTTRKDFDVVQAAEIAQSLRIRLAEQAQAHQDAAKAAAQAQTLVNNLTPSPEKPS